MPRSPGQWRTRSPAGRPALRASPRRARGHPVIAAAPGGAPGASGQPAGDLLLAERGPGGLEISGGPLGASLLQGMEAAEGEGVVAVEVGLHPVLTQPLTGDDRVLMDSEGLLDLLGGGGQGAGSLADDGCGGLSGVPQSLGLLPRLVERDV